MYSYRHVKLISEQRVAQALQHLEEIAPSAEASGLHPTQAHDLIRSPQEYGDLFAKAAAAIAATAASWRCPRIA